MTKQTSFLHTSKRKIDVAVKQKASMFDDIPHVKAHASKIALLFRQWTSLSVSPHAKKYIFSLLDMFWVNFTPLNDNSFIATETTLRGNYEGCGGY